MKEYIKYKCSSCEYYDYKDENVKNYCSWYKTYYYDNDSCDHWRQGENYVDSYTYGQTGYTGSSGCFMTSACCEYKGLPDDCDELSTLRAFRDGYLMKQDETRALVQEYYRIAPGIVDTINARKDSGAIWEDVYSRICAIADLIRAGKKDRAISEYSSMVAEYLALQPAK